MSEQTNSIPDDMTYPEQEAGADAPALSTFTSVVGGILAVSYPVLAISTLFRAGYSFF